MISDSMRRSALLAPLFAIACAISFAFTIALSAAPGLHDWLHKPADQPAHHCAVTLVQSGGYHDHAESITWRASHGLTCLGGVTVFAAQIAKARGNFSSLEHAPPALS
jgi:hypothetical protein